MSRAKIKWGILGPGKIAHKFASDFQFTSNAELKAVASRTRARAQEFAEKFNIEHAYEGYEALYTDSDIDIIYIATPHNFHLEQSLKALASGKAVLCEKPITTKLSDAAELFEFAASKNLYLAEGMWTYFLPAIKKAMEWVKEGRIGKITSIKADFGFAKEYDPTSRLYNPALSGGVLLDMGIYPLAISRLFLDWSPINISMVARKAPSGVDDDVNLLIEYQDATATLHTTFRSKLHNHAYIIGDNGYIDIPAFWSATECKLYQDVKLIDHYVDNRKGSGFEFEIDSSDKLFPHFFYLFLEGQSFVLIGFFFCLIFAKK